MPTLPDASTPRPLTLTVADRIGAPAGTVCVVVSGAVVVESRHQLRQRVLDLLHDGARTVTLDLTACPYIDASGLGVLVSLQKHARERGGAIRLTGVSSDLRTLFTHTGLDRLFALTGPAGEAA